MKKITYYALVGATLCVPGVTFAVTAGNVGKFTEFGTVITNLVNFTNSTLIPLLFAAIFLIFAWGMFQLFVQGKGDADAKKKGMDKLISVVIGTVLILSFWGIVNLVSSGFGLSGDSATSIPKIQVGSQ